MKSCLICKQDVETFLPYKSGTDSVSPLLQTLKMVGSDVDNFLCPHCQSTDRERHLFIYFSVVPEFLTKAADGVVLHFAPEKYVSALVKNQQPREYIMADLRPNRPEVRAINMQAIAFPAAYFDVVIANHVLEHVGDDAQAISEVARVLKPGGYALLQTPYSAVLPSSIAEFSEPSEITRDMLFGEPDHARLYGTDIFRRIEQFGLRYVGGGHEKYALALDSEHYGINPDEPFFLFQK